MDNYYKICPSVLSLAPKGYQRIPSNCGCPAMLSDARIFTEYVNSKRVDEYIKNLNGIVRDDDFRMMLQKSGKRMLDNEWKYYRTNDSCDPKFCVHNYSSRVSPTTFPVEMNDYNNRYSGKSICENFSDYRLNP